MTNDDLMKEEDNLPETDPNVDYYEELTKPGGKYDRTRFKTEDELKKEIGKGKYEADNYIKVLEKRLDEYRNDILDLRKENVTSKQLEDLINQLSNKSPSNDEPQRKEERQVAFDSKQIESLVSSKIQEHDLSRQQTNNFNMVKNRIKERYGNNYKALLQEQIDDLDITEQDLNDMARNRPKVLLRTLGLDKPMEREQFQSPPSNSARSSAFKPTAGEERTWSYYKKLKAEKPDAWLDRRTAIQMQEDAIRLGDKFYDGDFYKKGLHEPN